MPVAEMETTKKTRDPLLIITSRIASNAGQSSLTAHFVQSSLTYWN